MYRFALMALILVASASAQADTTKGEVGLDVNTSFTEQHTRITTEMADGETYSEISAQDRTSVKQALDRIAEALAQAGSVEALNAKQKTEVFNDQELVNTILTKAAEDSRLVCKRVKKVGSHRTTTDCATVAQRRKSIESAQDEMRKVKVPTLEAR